MASSSGNGSGNYRSHTNGTYRDERGTSRSNGSSRWPTTSQQPNTNGNVDPTANKLESDETTTNKLESDKPQEYNSTTDSSNPNNNLIPPLLGSHPDFPPPLIGSEYPHHHRPPANGYSNGGNNGRYNRFNGNHYNGFNNRMNNNFLPPNGPKIFRPNFFPPPLQPPNFFNR